MAQAIQVSQLSKTFGTRKALKSVDLSIQPGEMVALIGPSGSGKSTLLRSLGGMNVGDTGTVTIGNRKVQSNGKISSEIRSVRRGLGVIFQQFNLVGRLSLMTNVLMGCLGRIPGWRGTLGFFPVDEKEKAVAALDRVGLSEYGERRASTLSGGQQQRGAIARALLQGANTLLADEPIASLDPVSARRVMELLARLNVEEGLTVVVSLHQVDAAVTFCKRVIAMRDGAMVYDGAPAGLTQDILRNIYGPEYEDFAQVGVSPA
ncbi:phosphonate ABC transporter ATP-binding protein [Sphingoaurantiacus capsulatus]|uniref:Phosphonate ABC transporter ATP-binding protein n=1 Tax=Sphingoaurantiacus capsulatus TaxID=1771310 RepID=A0ABV7X6Z6_9SPHN